MKTGANVRIWHEDKSVIGDCWIGDDCTIHAPVWIGDEVVIGNGCKVQAFAFIPKGVTIGDGCFIGPHVCFTNDKEPPSGGEHWAETKVGNSTVIGARAVILPGVTIGNNCVIAAGSIVTKDVPIRHRYIHKLSTYIQRIGI